MLVPALPAIGLFAYWAAHGGGYAPTTWLPSGLLVLGLLVVSLVGLGRSRLRLTPTAGIALGALALYTAWSYLSIVWAGSPGDAFEGSNRTLLYLLLFALFALLPWRPETGLIALSAFALAIGVIAVVTLVRIGVAAELPKMFVQARLMSPVGYVNGAAALFTIGALVALGLAAQRELHFALRAVLATVATAGLQVAVLSESRGWLIALPLLLIVLVALVPRRMRMLLWCLPVAAGVLAATPALLDVFTRTDDAGPQKSTVLFDAAHHARLVALVALVGVLAVSAAMAFLDRRVTVAPRTSASLDRGLAVVAIAVACAGVLASLVATDFRPDQKFIDYWDRSAHYTQDEGASRFSAIGTNRPDFWRVAIDSFADHPLLGLGQDNFAEAYLLDRRSTEQPRWTHSVELRLLTHTGIVGFLLFLVFLVASVFEALRRRRRASLLAASTAALALVPLAAWLVQGSIDWFWEFPALSGPALAFLGLAAALRDPQRGIDAPGDGAASSGFARRRRQPAVERAPGSLGPVDTSHSPVSSANRASEPMATGSRPLPARAGGERAAAADAERVPGEGARRPLVIASVICGTALTAVIAAVFALPYIADRDVADASANWRKDPANAFSQLDRASDLNPLSSQAQLTAGVIGLQMNAPARAASAFAAAHERAPGDWFALLGEGLAESQRGDGAAAAAAYRLARARNPHEPLLATALKRVASGRPLTYGEAFASLQSDVSSVTGGAP